MENPELMESNEELKYFMQVITSTEDLSFLDKFKVQHGRLQNDAQRFRAWRSGGFLAQKFNRRTALEPTTKLSYEALHPPLRQTAVSKRYYLLRTIL